MKNGTIIILLLLAAAPLVKAQERSDIFNPKTKITWLGLDFTSAKFIGDREKLGTSSDIHLLLNSLNDLMIIEEDKFDIAQAIDRIVVERGIDVTRENNAKLDAISLCSDSENDYLHLSKIEVEKIIAGYDFKGLQGVGLMFNVESFSKLNVEASVWVTFVNMGTKEVYFTERLVAPPKGFGLRNYWAGAIYAMMEKIRKKEYAMWRIKFYRP